MFKSAFLNAKSVLFLNFIKLIPMLCFDVTIKRLILFNQCLIDFLISIHLFSANLATFAYVFCCLAFCAVSLFTFSLLTSKFKFAFVSCVAKFWMLAFCLFTIWSFLCLCNVINFIVNCSQREYFRRFLLYDRFDSINN